MFGPIRGKIMERAKLLSSSSRMELMVMAGTILAMVLSSVCVVVLCAAANATSGTRAKITYVAPAASAAGDLGAPTDVAGAIAAVTGLR